MRKGRNAINVLLCSIVSALLVPYCSAQDDSGTGSVPAGSGTLTFNYSTTNYECGAVYAPTTYSITTFSNFTYTTAGISESLTGDASDQWNYTGTRMSGCPGRSTAPPVTLRGSQEAVIFTAQAESGSASVNLYQTGYINPKYIVVGVTYAPPGAQSFVSYTSGLAISSTTGISKTLSSTTSTTTTISGGGVIKGFYLGKVDASSSSTDTQSTTNSSSVTINQQVQFTNKTFGTGGNVNSPVNHDYDLIWLWLNPVTTFSIDPNFPQAVYWTGYGYDENDQPGMDIYPVALGYLNGDLGPLDPSSAAVLARSWANNSQVFGPGQVAGITPADYPDIASADPYSTPGYGVSLQPGISPATTTDGRFTISGGPNNVNSSFDFVQALPGSSPLTQSYQNSYSNASTQGTSSTKTHQTSYSVDKSIDGTGFLVNFSANVKQEWMYTTTNTTNSSLTNTQSQVDMLSITGPACNSATAPCVPTYSGPGEFNVYQDNLYGTFMFNPL